MGASHPRTVRVVEPQLQHARRGPSLTPTAEGTRLVIEERGVPLDQLAAYGAGWQVHAEDLAAHVTGGERDDDEARWVDVVPTYQAMLGDQGVPHPIG